MTRFKKMPVTSTEEAINDNPAAIWRKPLWTQALLQAGVIGLEGVQNAWERESLANLAEIRKRFPNGIPG